MTKQYGRLPFGDNPNPRVGTPGISIPGYDSIYYYNLVSTTGQTPYGGSAYGGRQAIAYPAAGIFAVAEPDNGFVTLPVWWGFARTLNVTRVTSGTRTPVRGSNPAFVSGVSRRNGATNPKVRDAIGANYTAGSNTTISRITGQTTPSEYVTTALRATATGSGGITINLTLDSASPSGSVWGFWVKTATAATTLGLSVTWYDASSVPQGTETFLVDATARTEAVGQWRWVEIPVFAGYPLAATGVVSIIATGLASNGTVDITGRLVEQGSALQGAYFDGDYPFAAWIGTPGLSYSDIAPMTSLIDGEAPLDEEVYYELTNPLVPGIVATSNTVTLGSRGNRSWLTHPAYPTRPIRVNVLGPFGPITRSIVQGEYYPLDSVDGLPIVKTQSRRRGRKGAIKILSTSHIERDELLDLFADGSPVMVRSPKTYGHGTMWLSLGDLTEDQAAYWSESPFRTLSADYTEVVAPLTANEAV